MFNENEKVIIKENYDLFRKVVSELSKRIFCDVDVDKDSLEKAVLNATMFFLDVHLENSDDEE
jgi:hypothetical protein